MRCSGKVALVTGAAGSGMGRSVALTLAREGAQVVVNTRNSLAAADAVVAEMVARGGDAMATQGDITRAEDCARLVAAAVARYGQVDICVVGPGGGWHPQPPYELDAAGALDDLNAEVAPLYHLMPLVLPGMRQRGRGRLIGIAQHPTKRSPAYAYNAGKGARLQALLLAADEAWKAGVTVNVIAPGPVAPIPSLGAAAEQCAGGAAWVERGNVSPQDIAEGVAFLCSEAGRYLNGCVLTYAFR